MAIFRREERGVRNEWRRSPFSSFPRRRESRRRTPLGGWERGRPAGKRAVSSESGFAGLWDFQDFDSARPYSSWRGFRLWRKAHWDDNEILKISPILRILILTNTRNRPPTTRAREAGACRFRPLRLNRRYHTPKRVRCPALRGRRKMRTCSYARPHGAIERDAAPSHAAYRRLRARRAPRAMAC